ncbi:MAG: hypothetical protein D6731_06240 [Planctomycetota bacterium]|nr:MAG: hypothetical protein D6731_06240 [Planctomycetota bacterium]
MRRLLCVSFPLLCGCATLPLPADPARLPRVELALPSAGTLRIYHTADISADLARRLLGHVAAVSTRVQDRLGASPPRTEIVLYRPAGPTASVSEGQVRETRADLVQEASGWRIRFSYPWSDDPRDPGQLLGTTAHEIAEATILLNVTVIDPYLRWVHDGVAEFAEHEALRELMPEVARENLRRTINFVRERREDGVTFVDLSRWRQLASYLVRSHRFLGPNESNLSLVQLGRSVRRVRNARVSIQDPLLLAGLAEIEDILVHARRQSRRPWSPGEARPDDPVHQDYLFYNAAFALWLELERASPGVAQRTLEAFAARRAKDDHVLSAAEAQRIVAEAAGRERLDLRVPIDRVESVLEAELARLP